MGRFFLEKFFKRVAYEKIKFKDVIDMKIHVYLSFVNCDWHGPNNPTTLEDKSQGAFEKFVGRD